MTLADINFVVSFLILGKTRLNISCKLAAAGTSRADDSHEISSFI